MLGNLVLASVFDVPETPTTAQVNSSEFIVIDYRFLQTSLTLETGDFHRRTGQPQVQPSAKPILEQIPYKSNPPNSHLLDRNHLMV